MLLFNASLINITQSLLRLEQARLLESQSEHDEWMGLKLNIVPYVFAEGNANYSLNKLSVTKKYINSSVKPNVNLHVMHDSKDKEMNKLRNTISELQKLLSDQLSGAGNDIEFLIQRAYK